MTGADAYIARLVVGGRKPCSPRGWKVAPDLLEQAWPWPNRIPISPNWHVGPDCEHWKPSPWSSRPDDKSRRGIEVLLVSVLWHKWEGYGPHKVVFASSKALGDETLPRRSGS